MMTLIWARGVRIASSVRVRTKFNVARSWSPGPPKLRICTHLMAICSRIYNRCVVPMQIVMDAVGVRLRAS
jgi:hypothetical protein